MFMRKEITCAKNLSIYFSDGAVLSTPATIYALGT